MNKSSIQRKFRFVMVIAALALFITIFTPVYINYGKNSGYPKVIMMWTVLFGTGGGKTLNPLFDFSWIAFTGYALVLILLIISLVRKFITVEGSEKATNAMADAACMICSLLSLVMFILLPFVITKTSVNGAGVWVIQKYGWGVAYILNYVILAVMFVSSLIVLYAETIIKYKKLKDKKQALENKENNKEE